MKDRKTREPVVGRLAIVTDPDQLAAKYFGDLRVECDLELPEFDLEVGGSIVFRGNVQLRRIHAVDRIVAERTLLAKALTAAQITAEFLAVPATCYGLPASVPFVAVPAKGSDEPPVDVVYCVDDEEIDPDDPVWADQPWQTLRSRLRSCPVCESPPEPDSFTVYIDADTMVERIDCAANATTILSGWCNVKYDRMPDAADAPSGPACCYLVL